MLILRLKQAECAAADGRLDEAFERVRNATLRAHRRGQRLASKYAGPLGLSTSTIMNYDTGPDLDERLPAAVELAGGRLHRGDVRHCILLDRHLAVSAGTETHVRANHLDEPVVFYLRDDRLFCLTVGVRKIESGQSHRCDPSSGMSMGQTLQVGRLSIHLTEP